MSMKILRESGLRQTELAALLGVTRITVNKCLKKDRPPKNRGRDQTVKRLVAIVQQLTAKGILPMAEDWSSQKRAGVVTKIKSVLHPKVSA